MSRRLLGWMLAGVLVVGSGCASDPNSLSAEASEPRRDVHGQLEEEPSWSARAVLWRDKSDGDRPGSATSLPPPPPPPAMLP